MKERPENFNANLVRRYGAGFFAIYKRARRVAAHATNLTDLWQELKTKNVDLKKVIIARLPPGHWRYRP